MSRALNGLILLALPPLFILLQAIFPQLGAGSWQCAFSALPRLFADDALLAMWSGTLKVGVGVVLCSLAVGLPLGVLWDLLFLVPFLTPPYIAAQNWTLALQRNGYRSICSISSLRCYGAWWPLSSTISPTSARSSLASRRCCRRCCLTASTTRRWWRRCLSLSKDAVASADIDPAGHIQRDQRLADRLTPSCFASSRSGGSAAPDAKSPR
nr:ABC transporter permease [Candidatus Pantoea persica]